jgi:hypothetical protein
MAPLLLKENLALTQPKGLYRIALANRDIVNQIMKPDEYTAITSHRRILVLLLKPIDPNRRLLLDLLDISAP